MDPLTPAVGTPATFCIGSDRYPGAVEAVFTGGREIWMTTGNGLKKFTYRPALSRRSGRPVYLVRGQTYGYLHVGEAMSYRDPSF